MNPAARTETSLLSIENLYAEFSVLTGVARAVRDVSLSIERGEMLAIVGESGSGKSALALSILDLLPEPGRITGGRILLDGRDILLMSESELRSVRGGRAAMVFQDPMTSLNPYLTIGRQMSEVTELHLGLSRQKARERAVEMLRAVKISEPERRIDQHPHELSGGMRQRVMIAMALSCEPSVIIADEPTTALDTTIQAGILDLFAEIRSEKGTGIILITHDLFAAKGRADRVIVMYAGQVFEESPAAELFAMPSNPYTIALLMSMPDRPAADGELYQIPGMPPDVMSLGPGCAFAPRCERAENICHTDEPRLVQINSGHRSRCHFAANRG